MVYNLNIEKDQRARAILMLLDFDLKLTKLELDIVCTLINNNITIITTKVREFLREALNKDKYIINNYIIGLASKRVFLSREGDRALYLDPNLINVCKETELTFKL